MISGGFGESLDVAEMVAQEQMLRAFYRASVHHVAKTKQPHDAEFDDLVQEGVVAAWRAVQTPRTDPTTYGAVSARNRITKMVTDGRPMVGSEAEPGKRIHDLARQTAKREDFAVTEEILDRGNPFVAVEQRVDMQRALRVLEPRDQALAYLVGLDQSWDVIGPKIGLAPTSARNRWDRQVRPALREALVA